jgi:hypothetical protein
VQVRDLYGHYLPAPTSRVMGYQELVRRTGI